MNTLTKRDGYETTSPWLRDFFNVENMFPREWLSTGQSLPAVNISEDDNNYLVEVMAPGFKKEDFKVNLEDDVLTISAEMKAESSGQNKQYSRREYSYNSFTRSFRLPENAKTDNVDASYKDGVLKLSIAKTKNEGKKGKEIKIN